MAKYIFVTGGVTSSLGKGIIAASLQAAARKFAPGLLKDPKKRRGAGRNLHARNCQRISAGFISAARYALA